MIIVRIIALVVALSLTLGISCASEDATVPPQAASVQPTTAPEPTSSSSATAASVTAPFPTATAKPEERDLNIVTLLPFDAIPAVLDPKFISADDADAKLAELLQNRARRDADKAPLADGSDPDDALVLGVSVNGDSRAYYIPSLSAVEIINDDVGGQPLAVTW